MRVVETCCCGARFETDSHIGISDFRKAHADCRAAWAAHLKAATEVLPRTPPTPVPALPDPIKKFRS